MGRLAAESSARQAAGRLARVLESDGPGPDHAGKRGAGRLLQARPAGEHPLPGRGAARLADRSRRSVHHHRRAGRSARPLERSRSQRNTRGALDLHLAAADPLFPGPNRIRTLSPDSVFARRVPARARTGAPIAVIRCTSAALCIAALAALSTLGGSSQVAAQDTVRPDPTAGATYPAGSPRLSRRPRHAAETLLAAAQRDPHPNAFLLVEGAQAELQARRYERARTLLAGQPWLEDYVDGEALAVLAQAEYGPARYTEAATHFGRPAMRAPPPKRPPPPGAPRPPCRGAQPPDHAATA